MSTRATPHWLVRPFHCLVSSALLPVVFALGCSAAGGDSNEPEADSVSAELSCAGIPQWVAKGPYTAGSKVVNGGKAYQCRPSPSSRLCPSASYQPGVAAAWADAWTLLDVCSAPACGTARSSAERPDDQPGLYQMRVWYVLSSDGVDQHRDTDGTIRTSVESVVKWMKAKTGGRTFRIDRCQGAIDIGFLKLSKTDAQLNQGDVLHNLGAEMNALHLLGNAKKMNLVYYGGSNRTCGNSNWPSVPGQFSLAALYLNGDFQLPGVPKCNTNPVGANLNSPGYMDFSLLHEVFHMNGAAATCAPHAFDGIGHVSDSNQDLMYAGSQPWDPQFIDVNHNDYFDTGSTTCLDVARSTFIEPLPAKAVPPVNW
jgi:hypothetical protein